jgi:RimJ/RimL family protein N-acetyltransferase
VTTIETSRLLLRPPRIEDLDELVAIHAEPAVKRFMGRFERPDIMRWMELAERDWEEHGYGRVAIIQRRDGRLLGRTGLKYWLQFGETEVGWVLRTDAWGRGFATEAAIACLDWGFQNLALAYVTAMIRPDNTRSIRVAERLGMSPLREDVLMEEPVTVHSVSRPRWTREQGE